MKLNIIKNSGFVYDQLKDMNKFVTHN